MTLCLILSGDIPGNKQKSPTCSTCNKTVRSNSKNTYCTVRRSITHLKCITPNKKMLFTSMQDWICSFCVQSVLPFYKVRDLHTLDSSTHNEYENIEYQNKHLDVLKKHHEYTSVAHLNTRSLPSSFDEFSYMMTQLEYVPIDGFQYQKQK